MCEDWKEFKAEAVARLRALNVGGYRLGEVDGRLLSYVEDVRSDPERHNLYEVLAVLKFFRLMDKYVFRVSKVRKFVKLYESLKFSGLDGRRRYRLTPIQYFQFASMLGFYRVAGPQAGGRQVVAGDAGAVPGGQRGGKGRKKGRAGKASAEAAADGEERPELRRLVREAILFVPRKFSKTTSTASLAVNELLFGDMNAQAYTAANSYKQATICFREISKIVKQLDPKKRYFKATRELLRWKDNPFGKESFVECLTGGGDTKDGLNASLVIFDEYAQARYVKGHSDGAELIQVLRSSMGARRDPLTVIITTASRVEDGPFALELENAKSELRGEYTDDTLFASIFQPDEWELTEEAMGDPNTWRKCNPHIGITIQPDYYDTQWVKAQRDAESMIEFKTKLLNVFVSGNVKPWISQGLARSLSAKVDPDLLPGRPETMCAFDLSVSDDLSAVAYTSYLRAERRFHVKVYFYIPEETVADHPNRELYRYWIENGWLRTCAGAVIDSRRIVEDVLEMNRKVRILQIGYDAYKAQDTVNALAAAIGGTGSDPWKVLKAVPQTYGAFTSPVETFELAAKSRPAKVVLDDNPILAYCFGNCYLDTDRMENKKPLKRKENLKIDGAIATLMTFWLFNNYTY